jgi:hypothetical protein
MTNRTVVILGSALFAAVCCTRGRTGAESGEGNVKESPSPHPPNGQPASLEQLRARMGELTSGAAIDIRPIQESGGVVFKFRREGNADAGLDIPLVQTVMVEKVGEQAVTCELKSAGYLPLGEWRYGDEPSGFHKASCKPLDRGEYEVLAYGYGANGTAHIKVDESGRVTRTR